MSGSRSDSIPSTILRHWLAELAGDDAGVVVRGVRQGWGQLEAGKAVGGGPLRLEGRECAHGLGSHADSVIAVRSGRPIRALRARVGLDDNQHTAGCAIRLRFAVEAAGKSLWTSGPLGTGAAAMLDLALPGGVRELRLTAVSVDGNLQFAHADWAEAVVVLDDGSEVRLEDAVRGTGSGPDPIPFSFRFDGRDSAELLPGWERSHQRRADGEVIHHTLRWREPAGRLECRLELTAWLEDDAVDWVVHLRNPGTQPGGLLEDIQALDQSWRCGGLPVVHRAIGSQCRIDDFLPRTDPLPKGASLRMAAGGGRSSNEWLPFVDVVGTAISTTTAIGWTGQWAFSCAHGEDGSTRLRAGLELTRIRLLPGEEIRTPRILQRLWSGDRVQAHNQWRRLLTRRVLPRAAGGGAISGPVTMGHWGGMRTAEHLERLALYRANGLAGDMYWVDAGWYGPADSVSPDEHRGDWARRVGNWQVNPAAHPQGLGVLGDGARAAGMGLLLWFEPERAIQGTPWTIEHPEWFLGGRHDQATLLFDLGNPTARAWLTDTLSARIREAGIACYRQDFNFDPLPYWRGNDAPDRQGMTEIRHIEGLYAMWDELLARHPGLLIDNCASGGRRIDLETIARSIPLWRSDWQCFAEADPVGSQVHGMGLSDWIPLHGTGTWASMPRAAGDTYLARSAMGPATMLAAFPYAHSPVSAAYPWEWHRRMIAEARRVGRLSRADYHPLTPCSVDPTLWAAWRMDDPESGEGFVLAFRRSDSPWTTAEFRLEGLLPTATYEFEDADTARTWRMGGQELIGQGLPFSLPERRSSRLVFYRRVAVKA